MDVGNGVRCIQRFKETKCDLFVDLMLRVLEKET